MINNFFITIIKIYQRLFSPFLRPRCVFYPTCSEYAKNSLIKHGVLKSFFPVVRRFFSCHPFTKKEFWDPIK